MEIPFWVLEMVAAFTTTLGYAGVALYREFHRRADA